MLSIKPFRALWIALSLSSLGDWLSILALLALAPSVTHGSNLAKTSSISGVWVVTLLPALLLGPIAGALADRFDRRMTMIVGDVIRGLLFISIPLFPNLTWIFVAKFLAGIASQFWNPAAAATIPNLVPKEKLERANQLSQLMTYGTAPLAAGLLAVLGCIATGLGHVIAGLPHQQGGPGAVLQRRVLLRLRDHRLLPAADRQAGAQRADLGAVHRQGHLGGLAVHPEHARSCAAW